MKKFVKFIYALAISAAFSTPASASMAYYGPRQPSYYSQVSFYNNTADDYFLNATFYTNYQQVVQTFGFYLGQFGAGQDIVTYAITPPATYVCVSSTRQIDQYTIFPPACTSNQDYIIYYPYLASSTAGLSAKKATPILSVKK